MGTRRYRKRKRAKHEAATRERIVKAAVALHRERGPASTTVSAIAERAGVQRLTVYRHFPDQAGLFQACSAHWYARHPFPDPDRWSDVRDAAARTRTALEALYAYYDKGQEMLASVLRDAEDLPAMESSTLPFRSYVAAVADSLSTGWRVRGSRLRRVRAAVGHAVQFQTWRSLTDQGLDSAQAAELMTALVTATASPGQGGSPRR